MSSKGGFTLGEIAAKLRILEIGGSLFPVRAARPIEPRSVNRAPRCGCDVERSPGCHCARLPAPRRNLGIRPLRGALPGTAGRISAAAPIRRLSVAKLPDLREVMAAIAAFLSLALTLLK